MHLDSSDIDPMWLYSFLQMIRRIRPLLWEKTNPLASMCWPLHYFFLYYLLFSYFKIQPSVQAQMTRPSPYHFQKEMLCIKTMEWDINVKVRYIIKKQKALFYEVDDNHALDGLCRSPHSLHYTLSHVNFSGLRFCPINMKLCSMEATTFFFRSSSY